MDKRGYKIRDQSKPHFMTFTVVNWIDIFSRKAYEDLIVDNLNYCISNKGLVIHAYVIMSNHVHLIIQSEDKNLSGLVRDFKKFTSKAILEQIHSSTESRSKWMLELFRKSTETHSRNKIHQFWRYGNHPEEIYSTKFLWTKLDYIHLNPVRAGIVEKASEYVYSSAKNYVFNEGVVEVTLADNPIIDTQKDDSFWKSIRW
jgi:REP element-mobilizing transposase RayT